MKKSKSEIIKDLLQLNKYLGGRAKKFQSPIFEGGFKASTEIISIIENTQLKKEDLEQIVKIFNQVTDQPHDDGSGWFDFKIKIMHLLDLCGLEAYEDGEKIGIKVKMKDNG